MSTTSGLSCTSGMPGTKPERRAADHEQDRIGDLRSGRRTRAARRRREEREEDQRVVCRETHGLGNSRSEAGSRAESAVRLALGSPSMSRYPDENVVGGVLLPCSTEPMTGFFRDGCCGTGPEDVGSHTVCTVMTEDFLAFSKAAGNDSPRHGPSGALAACSRETAGACARRGGSRPITPAVRHRSCSARRTSARSRSSRSRRSRRTLSSPNSHRRWDGLASRRPFVLSGEASRSR